MKHNSFPTNTRVEAWDQMIDLEAHQLQADLITYNALISACRYLEDRRKTRRARRAWICRLQAIHSKGLQELQAMVDRQLQVNIIPHRSTQLYIIQLSIDMQYIYIFIVYLRIYIYTYTYTGHILELFVLDHILYGGELQFCYPIENQLYSCNADKFQ